MQGTESQGLKKPFRAAAQCSGFRTDEREERGVKKQQRRESPLLCRKHLSLTWITRINSLYRLGTFQITHKGLDGNVKRISSCSFCRPLCTSQIWNVTSVAISLASKCWALKRHSAYNLCPSLARDETVNKSFWDFSERRLLITRPWPEWCVERRHSYPPSTPRAGWLPRLHSKVTQLSFVPASIRLWLTDCAPPFEQMWFLASSNLKFCPRFMFTIAHSKKWVRDRRIPKKN